MPYIVFDSLYQFTQNLVSWTKHFQGFFRAFLLTLIELHGRILNTIELTLTFNYIISMWKIHYVVAETLFSTTIHLTKQTNSLSWIVKTIVQGRQIVQPILNNILIDIEFNDVGRMAHQMVNLHCQSYLASMHITKMQLQCCPPSFRILSWWLYHNCRSLTRRFKACGRPPWLANLPKLKLSNFLASM